MRDRARAHLFLLSAKSERNGTEDVRLGFEFRILTFEFPAAWCEPGIFLRFARKWRISRRARKFPPDFPHAQRFLRNAKKNETFPEAIMSPRSSCFGPRRLTAPSRRILTQTMMIAFEINRCFVVARTDPEARDFFTSFFAEEIQEMKRIPFTIALFSAEHPWVTCIADIISPSDNCDAKLVSINPERQDLWEPVLRQ